MLVRLLLVVSFVSFSCGPSRVGNDAAVQPVDAEVFADNDHDGFDVRTDCNDNDNAIYPGAPELCGDNIDSNCDNMGDLNCLTPCDVAAMRRSSVGCVFYPVDTNPFQAQQYAIAVSNVHETSTANVVVETKAGNVWSPVPNGSFAVSPLAVQTIPLPHRAVNGSALYAGGAYRVTSDLPVIAYQFNPLNGAASYYSDASLLLPSSAYDIAYIVPAWPYGQADAGDYYPAHVQIAAASDTQVTITSPIATTAGGGVPALAANVPQAFTLQEGDLLQLTAATINTSFNGLVVDATRPVGVFTSNECVNVPLASCCCEHLEEQVFGLQTWGKNYVASRLPQRAAEPALWQIMAQQDQTTVTFSAPAGVTGLPASVTLNARQMVEYSVNGPANAPGDFVVGADKPVLVTQYMVAGGLAGGQGDPSMVQAVAVEQYLPHYVIIVPTTWVYDFAVLTRTAGSSVEVDGVPVSTGWLGAGGGYEVARVAIADGVHRISGARPVGVLIVGYDSYAYPGGLDQQLINPVE